MLWVNLEGGAQTTYAPLDKFVDKAYPLIGAPFQIKSAWDAYLDVIQDVGANASLNADGTVTQSVDKNDAFYLNIMAQGEGAFHPYQMYDKVRSWFDEQLYADFVNSISTTPIATRPANYYVSNPHIPEVWFKANVPQGKDHNDTIEIGYTYLNLFTGMVDINK